MGRLTDFQVWHLVVRPAVIRAREAKGGRRRKGRKLKSRLPTREEYVMMGRQFGYTDEYLNAEYDRAAGTQG